MFCLATWRTPPCLSARLCHCAQGVHAAPVKQHQPTGIALRGLCMGVCNEKPRLTHLMVTLAFMQHASGVIVHRQPIDEYMQQQVDSKQTSAPE